MKNTALTIEFITKPIISVGKIIFIGPVRMKLVKLLLSVFVIVIVAGFAYIALTDVPVEKNQVTKTIPNERFFGG
jgi:hypothetical protein